MIFMNSDLAQFVLGECYASCTMCADPIVAPTEPPVVTAPPATEAATTKASTTEAPATEASMTETPTTEAPATVAPASCPPDNEDDLQAISIAMSGGAGFDQGIESCADVASWCVDGATEEWAYVANYVKTDLCARTCTC